MKNLFKDIGAWFFIIIAGILALATWPLIGLGYAIYVLFSPKIKDSDKVKRLEVIVGVVVVLLILAVWYSIWNTL